MNQFRIHLNGWWRASTPILSNDQRDSILREFERALPDDAKSFYGSRVSEDMERESKWGALELFLARRRQINDKALTHWATFNTMKEAARGTSHVNLQNDVRSGRALEYKNGFAKLRKLWTS